MSEEIWKCICGKKYNADDSYLRVHPELEGDIFFVDACSKKCVLAHEKQVKKEIEKIRQGPDDNIPKKIPKKKKKMWCSL